MAERLVGLPAPNYKMETAFGNEKDFGKEFRKVKV